MVSGRQLEIKSTIRTYSFDLLFVLVFCSRLLHYSPNVEEVEGGILLSVVRAYVRPSRFLMYVVSYERRVCLDFGISYVDSQ